MKQKALSKSRANFILRRWISKTYVTNQKVWFLHLNCLRQCRGGRIGGRGQDCFDVEIIWIKF